MGRMVVVVLKVVAFVIIFGFVLDTTQVAVDTMMVYKRMSNTAIVLKDEVIRNNSVPDSLQSLFNDQIKTITDKSIIAQEITSNINSTVTSPSGTYNSLAQSNPLEYGESSKVVIRVKMTPRFLSFIPKPADNGTNGDQSFVKQNWLTYYLEVTEDVVGLRYLK